MLAQRGQLPPLDAVTQLPHTPEQSAVAAAAPTGPAAGAVGGVATSIYLDNRQMNGQAGLPSSLTPLQLADGECGAGAARLDSASTCSQREQMAPFAHAGLVSVEHAEGG